MDNVTFLLIRDNVLPSKSLASALNRELTIMSVSDVLYFVETDAWEIWPKTIKLDRCKSLENSQFYFDRIEWRKPGSIAFFCQLILSAAGEIASHGTRVCKDSSHASQSITTTKLLSRIEAEQPNISRHPSLTNICIRSSCMRKRPSVGESSPMARANFKKFSKAQSRQRIPFIIPTEAMHSSSVVPTSPLPENAASKSRNVIISSRDCKDTKFQSSLFKNLNMTL